MRPAPLPAGIFSGPQALLTSATGPFTVIVGPGLARRWQLPADWHSLTEMPLYVEGWAFGSPYPWVTAVREGGLKIPFLFWHWHTAHRSPAAEWPLYGDLVAAHPDMVSCVPELGERFARWELLTGHRAQGSPGVTGSIMLRDMHRGRRPQPLWHWTPPTPLQSAAAVELHWRSERLRTAKHTVMYDRRRAYLASAVTAPVALGPLVHTPGQLFDPEVPGWWRVDADPWPWRDVPDPLYGYQGLGGVWVTTPMVALLREVADAGQWGGFTIHDAWTAKGSRVFRQWGELLRDCDRTLTGKEDPVSVALRDNVKQVWRRCLGLSSRKDGSVWRQDWYATIQEHTRAVVLRNVYRVYGYGSGPAPRRIKLDSISYDCETADPMLGNPGLKLGTGLGNWRIVDTMGRVAAHV
jgi:hypothetical protein